MRRKHTINALWCVAEPATRLVRASLYGLCNVIDRRAIASVVKASQHRHIVGPDRDVHGCAAEAGGGRVFGVSLPRAQESICFVAEQQVTVGTCLGSLVRFDALTRSIIGNNRSIYGIILPNALAVV